MTAPGIGALVGTVYLASRKSMYGAGARVVVGATIFGAGLICNGLPGNQVVAMISLGFVGLD